MAEERPRFAADAMLGSLARWLRLLGYDTTYDNSATDEQVVERAKAQGRIVLSRDRIVARRARGSLYVAEHDLELQLVEVFAFLGVEVPAHVAVERCSMCNAQLLRSDAAAARAAGVPDRVVEAQAEFWRCPNCARMYWRGTHVTSMERRLEALRARASQAHAGRPASVK